MNRRQFALASLATAAVAGCDSEPEPDHTATLLNNPAVHNAFRDLSESVAGLENVIGEFDSENWRDVVPNVKDATTGIANGLAELKRALGYSDSN
jgi:hypothetical protein